MYIVCCLFVVQDHVGIYWRRVPGVRNVKVRQSVAQMCMCGVGSSVCKLRRALEPSDPLQTPSEALVKSELLYN